MKLLTQIKNRMSPQLLLTSAGIMRCGWVTNTMKKNLFINFMPFALVLAGLLASGLPVVASAQTKPPGGQITPEKKPLTKPTPTSIEDWNFPAYVMNYFRLTDYSTGAGTGQMSNLPLQFALHNTLRRHDFVSYEYLVEDDIRQFARLMVSPQTTYKVLPKKPSRTRPNYNFAHSAYINGSTLVLSDTIFYSLPARSYSWNTNPVTFSPKTILGMRDEIVSTNYNNDTHGSGLEELGIRAGFYIGGLGAVPDLSNNEFILLCDGEPHVQLIRNRSSNSFSDHAVAVEYQCTPINEAAIRERFRIPADMPVVMSSAHGDDTFAETQAALYDATSWPPGTIMPSSLIATPAPTLSNVAAPPPFNSTNTNDDDNDPPARCVLPPSSADYGTSGSCNLKDPSNRRLLTAACDSSLEKKRSLCTHLLVPVLNNFYKQNPNLKPSTPQKPNYNYDTSNNICRLCNPDNDD